MITALALALCSAGSAPATLGRISWGALVACIQMIR